ncbi:hypothetical protein [Roseibium suaedae]|uniref:Uncharacterized protein n=1 Tax=Roseibium suaedae TaxID=735517 RepID=A0A1M7KDD6_9HYPH|nr:hypothetical protein [Roseibium suaedae]SHM63248.1 hypothetical protein SAMN05444272_2798 [Roseibium suaedae]
MNIWNLISETLVIPAIAIAIVGKLTSYWNRRTGPSDNGESPGRFNKPFLAFTVFCLLIYYGYFLASWLSTAPDSGTAMVDVVPSRPSSTEVRKLLEK